MSERVFKDSSFQLSKYSARDTHEDKNNSILGNGKYIPKKMASPVKESKRITPFLPSLFHHAVVKVAVPLFNHFGCRTLETVFNEIQLGNSAAHNEGSHENGDVNFIRAKKSLLFVPWHLRKEVMKTVINMQYEVSKWTRFHSYIFGREVLEYTFNWKSDGTINRTETAEKLVMNKNIDIHKRFYLACIYCLGDIMHDLWAELEAAGDTKLFLKAEYPLIRFWIGWIRFESHIPWAQAILQYLVFYSTRCYPIPRYSSIFPLLRPEDRQNLLFCLKKTSLDDLRLCLYTMTRKEEEEILKEGIRGVLGVYLETWTLQSMFLETAGKVWDYVDADSFCFLLHKILILKKNRKYIDFNEMFDGFWNMSPNRFREYATEWSRDESDLVFKEITGKKKQ